jgi:N-acetylneuraminic acid mutarotase
MATLGGTRLLFGGDDEGLAYLGDTWIWNGTGWTQYNGPGPNGRVGAAAATLAGKTVLFGGCCSVDPGGAATYFSDTWIWDGAGWTQQNVSGPSPRMYSTMVTLNDKVVLFGGLGLQNIKLGDTWVWDGNAWTNLNISGPDGRQEAAAATLNGKVVLFGGLAGGYLADTWLFDGGAWTPQNVSGPSPRFSAAAATLGGRVVLFGGSGYNALGILDFLDETWLWDGNGWTQQSGTGPSKRMDSVMTGPQ